MSKRNHSRSAAPYAKGYSEAGASVTRRALKGFTPDSGSPNEDINRNNATLRQRSRMLYMASPVATSAINTNRTKVVGTGLTLKATVDRDLLGLSPEAAKSGSTKPRWNFGSGAVKAELRRARPEQLHGAAAARAQIVAHVRRRVCPGEALPGGAAESLFYAAARH